MSARWAWIALIPVLSLLAFACGSDSELEEVKAERGALAAELAAMTAERDSLAEQIAADEARYEKTKTGQDAANRSS